MEMDDPCIYWSDRRISSGIHFTCVGRYRSYYYDYRVDRRKHCQARILVSNGSIIQMTGNAHGALMRRSYLCSVGI